MAGQPRVWGLYLLSVLLLILQLPFGEVGITLPGLGSVQPIEAVKTLLLVFFAHWVVRVLEIQGTRRRGALRLRERLSHLVHAVPILLILGLSYGLDDISPILIFSLFIYLMYRLSLAPMAPRRGEKIGLLDRLWVESVVVWGIFPAVVYALILPLRGSVFRRFLVWEDPWFRSSAHQIVSSYWAIAGVGGGGGWFGAGLGAPNGPLPPAVQDDFILALIGNTLGVVGLALLLLTYALFLLTGLRATRALTLPGGGQQGGGHRVARLQVMAGGGLLLFAIQIGLVFGSSTGWLPVVGQPLPFLSAGGSHLVLFSLPVVWMVLLTGVSRPRGGR